MSSLDRYATTAQSASRQKFAFKNGKIAQPYCADRDSVVNNTLVNLTIERLIVLRLLRPMTAVPAIAEIEENEVIRWIIEGRQRNFLSLVGLRGLPSFLNFVDQKFAREVTFLRELLDEIVQALMMIALQHLIQQNHVVQQMMRVAPSASQD